MSLLVAVFFLSNYVDISYAYRTHDQFISRGLLTPTSIQARSENEEDGEKRRSLKICHISDIPGYENAETCKAKENS